MERWIWFLGMAVFYGVLFLWFLNQVKKPDYKKNYVLVKTLQSAAFVSVFLAAAVVSQDILDFWLMLPAFVCCFAGDVMLAFYNKIKKKRLFLLGLVTFLMGHLFFIRWLDRMQPLAVTDMVFPVIAVIGVFAVTGMGSFHTGRLRPCILVYTFFIAYLFAKSMHIAVSIPTCGISSVRWEVFCLWSRIFPFCFFIFIKIRAGKSTCLTLPRIMWGFFFWQSVHCLVHKADSLSKNVVSCLEDAR